MLKKQDVGYDRFTWEMVQETNSPLIKTIVAKMKSALKRSRKAGVLDRGKKDPTAKAGGLQW